MQSCFLTWSQRFILCFASHSWICRRTPRLWFTPCAVLECPILSYWDHWLDSCNRSGHALEGASLHLQHVVRDTVMSHTFFQVAHVPMICCTTRGTRPGNPLGDLLFNMIMRMILQDAREYLLHNTPNVWMGSPAPCDSFAGAPEMPVSGFTDIAFVDDAAIAMHAPSLDQLQVLIRGNAHAMNHATRKRGMSLNFEKGKTEVLWIWSVTDRESRHVKQQIATDDGHLVWQQDDIQYRLSVTQSYRHLGTWMQAPPRNARDVQHRARLAKASWSTLSRPLYSKSYVALSTKTQVFQSLSMSRLLYNVHTWCSTTNDEWNRWQNHMRKPIGLMVKHSLEGQPPTHFETVDLFGMADVLSPIDQAHVARLRYFKRLLAYYPEMPRGLVGLPPSRPRIRRIVAQVVWKFLCLVSSVLAASFRPSSRFPMDRLDPMYRTGHQPTRRAVSKPRSRPAEDSDVPLPSIMCGRRSLTACFLQPAVSFRCISLCKPKPGRPLPANELWPPTPAGPMVTDASWSSTHGVTFATLAAKSTTPASGW